MFKRKAELIFVVTLFAVVFTSLIYIFPSKYAQMWLNIEIIVIPTFYLIGYEFMLHQQEREFKRKYNELYKVLQEYHNENTLALPKLPAFLLLNSAPILSQESSITIKLCFSAISIILSISHG